MTTIAQITHKCSVCGTVSEFTALASSNQMGSPDLDLRPAPMERYTMEYWLEECPNCGYISDQVSDPCDIDIEFLKSDKYRTCDGIGFKSELAKKFYKSYKIDLLNGMERKAFYAILHAAWACDDEKDHENASVCRKKAIPLITKMIAYSRNRNKNFLLIKADLLRRSGCFEQLLTEYADVKFNDQLLDQILAFQLEKAKQQDTDCYSVNQAMKPTE